MLFINNKKGFTLIEVLTSMLLLVLLTISLYAVVVSSNIWISKAGKSTRAITLANSIIEDIKANSYNIPVGVYNRIMIYESIGKNGLGLSTNYSDEKWGNYDISITINEASMANTSANNLLEVIVKVSWEEDSINYEEKLISIIARR
ncbi:MAG: prepilin-type N-terminal cleavage/methylation domain-containing protein [Syntrophomonadaceae bacterium]|nr:prepilin-type N-terminal cleavage/methylation domain-containing protein [Syntrophomonadaceae bacterium]